MSQLVNIPFNKYVTQKYHEQCMYDDHTISQNQFEVSIKNISASMNQKHHMQAILEYYYLNT